MDGVLASAVYALCFLTSSACAFLLARGFLRSGARLLLWSSLCFVFLAASNLLLVADLLFLAEQDLSVSRTLLALIGVGTLLFGFVWDLEEEA
ncbi:DUF5985 family protein [Sphingomonas glaciei]|uniref:DUF5985 family protein n=1 Tax=Sphingomonas glaciei TaxID=2938948 RepID=A0ABY5MS45_9SPHN|nr:DUF5985 family protein [Sphingomonas glaciei]UUR06749.1 DUF5985 family protein [Sphingomonas glaciei]